MEILIGKSPINCVFSIAMFDYRRVRGESKPLQVMDDHDDPSAGPHVATRLARVRPKRGADPAAARNSAREFSGIIPYYMVKYMIYGMINML